MRKIAIFSMFIFALSIIEKHGVMSDPVIMEKRNYGLGKANISLENPEEVRISIDDRPTCSSGATVPPSRVNTAERLAKLRDQMANESIQAYIIPSGDAHQSEYVSEADERRLYISGFSGSAGTAVVTLDQAALWTDGRYFLQAEDELDCNWILMKQGEDNLPSIVEWLKQTLAFGDIVGADSQLISTQTWLSYTEELAELDMTMVEPDKGNLVDLDWTDRPEYVQDNIFVHNITYAGKYWQDKVVDVFIAMDEKGADMLILTALDEIAWLLNLRGSDIAYNPVFRSYVTLQVNSNMVNLYVPMNKVTQEVEDHLSPYLSVNIYDYDQIWFDLRNAKPSKVMIPSGASYAIYSHMEEESIMMTESPVTLMKAQKNEVEVQGMKNAHVKDAVALCEFLHFMEKEISSGETNWTEISAADKLTSLRAEQELAMGDSFAAISGFGSNGAVIHYEASNVTDTVITDSSLYLLDSGGQYLDGTTDVTRTMHYGQPTAFMIEAYTRVLMGHIDLASAVFPEGTGDARLDILARGPLFDVGLDYNHGTGHGIGMFLGVHEDPISVAIYATGERELKLGYFLSNEPGYYKDYEFGIRIENIMTVVKRNTTHNMTPMLAFETVTLVPYEAKLIDTSLLNAKQCDWLNNYHAQVLEVVGAELLNRKQTETYDWLKTKTEPLCVVEVENSAYLTTAFLLVLMTGICVSLLGDFL